MKFFKKALGAVAGAVLGVLAAPFVGVGAALLLGTAVSATAVTVGSAVVGGLIGSLGSDNPGAPVSHAPPPPPPPPPPTYNIVSKNVQFIGREQVFRFSISGLIPKTIHNMYIDGAKVASDRLKPLSGSLGTPLKTDENGKLTFDYFYQSNLPAATTPFEQAQEQASLVVGTKTIIVASIADDILPSTPLGVLSWYKTSIVVNVATSGE